MVDSCGWSPEMVDDDLDNRPDPTEQEDGGTIGVNPYGPSTPANAPNSGSNGGSCQAIRPYYPPNDGFQGKTTDIVLEKGTLIQRTGSTKGSYVAPAGTPTSTLSLPPNQAGQATTVYVVTSSIHVRAGTAAPWFDSMGGGTQYKLLDGNLQYLLDAQMVMFFGG